MVVSSSDDVGRPMDYMPIYLSPSASPEIFCVPLGAGIDPTSVLHKRHQWMAGFLDPRHIPQRPRPLADGLIIELVFARATNYGGKRVCFHINRQPSKLERASHQFLGLSSAAVMLDNREHGPQVPINCIPTSILLKIVPGIADVPEPLSQRFFRLIDALGTMTDAANNLL